MPSGQKSGQFWVRTPRQPHRPKLMQILRKSHNSSEACQEIWIQIPPTSDWSCLA